MPSSRLRALAPPLAVILFASCSLVCSGVQPGARSDGAGPGNFLERSAKTSEGTLTFPPPDGDRSARRDLGRAGVKGSTVVLAVSGPELGADRKFAVVGTSVRIAFNQAMERGKAVAGAKKGELTWPMPGAVTLTPDVPGTTRWIDDRTLEFAASGPFEKDRVYAVAVHDVASLGGAKLDEPWKASFTASPSFVVAGKELGYFPAAGAHRVIAIHPFAGSRVGRGSEMSVLFDQPIDLGVAAGLIKLTGIKGVTLPSSLAHPIGPTFQGIKVDPRYVVLVRPAAPLPAGQDIELVAEDHTKARTARSSDFTVVDPLALRDVTCGWGGEDECSFTKGVLRTSEHSVHVLFNNPLDMSGKALAQRVRVTPPVKNLSIRSEGWDEGRIVIGGQLVSSTTYDVAIDGLRDRFGQALGTPVHFKLETAPESASVSMPEGLILLDEATTKRFVITTRNLESAELAAWPVKSGDGAAFEQALGRVRERNLPEEAAAIVIPVAITPTRDKSVETAVDLSTKLAAGTSYVVALRAGTSAFGAGAMKFPRNSEATRPPVALLGPGSSRALAVHARSIAGATLVNVARLGSGEPVAGATVRFDGDEAKPAVTTDAQGMALLSDDASATRMVVHASDADLILPVGSDGITAKALFPGLSSGAEAGDADKRAVVVTDRGIYRPGSTAFIKASLRRPDGARLLPMAGASAVIHVVGPTGEDALRSTVTTNDLGSAAIAFAVPEGAKLGRYQVRVEDPERSEPPIAKGMIQIAEFEAPRFAVDVDVRAEAAKPGKKARAAELAATVRARYLFGAAMDGAQVSWTLKRSEARFPAGPLTDELSFRARDTWYDDDDDVDDEGDAPPRKGWSRAGTGKVAADGTLVIKQALDLDPTLGPQEFSLEADVADTSFRHIAGRAAVTMHPAQRYAGLKLARGWLGVGEAFPVELGVIDTEGQPVVGARVTARVERMEWKYVQRRGAGGALRWDWTSRRAPAGSCVVTSARTPVTCSLTATAPGDYEVIAEVDGRRGGTRSFWAWREGDTETTPSPNRGRTLEISPDKTRYRPGDTAKLMVKSPYAAATAILTVEQGGLLSHSTRKIQGGGALFEVPLTAASAPHVHATVTLLPLGAKGEGVADYRIGAVRIPVALEGARLQVALKSDKGAYEPGEEATITVDVSDDGKPEGHAEIALAVVDEGILRLTSFHAIDPVPLLHPGRALAFKLRDSRRGLAELFERSHTAGDGEGGKDHATIGETRKKFVETALWRPDLRTDANGRATVKFKLPDNLTQFRIMAVVLDDEGKGAASEAAFTVRKPVMLVPIVPRFAAAGDRFEAAAMLHNNTGDPITAKVTLAASRGGARAEALPSVMLTVSAGGQSRVAFPIKAEAPGEITLSFAVAGAAGPALDRVEARVPVEEPGLDERPHLEGAFSRSQEIALEIPEDARGGASAALTIQVGQHLWPELGQRLDYLLDYPHGCVEQTTSSTLPLIAARAILPRIGFTKLSDGELKVRIRSGLDRLATMRTEGGGLAYWPGGSEPNVYGTAYAIRAVVLARAAGVEAPKGLLEGMKSYLGEKLLASDVEPEVQAAIAQSLSDLGELPASASDALQDRADKQSVFGKASLALALHGLAGQEDRVAALLDAVEASFDEKGALLVKPGHKDFYYYGSPTRSAAQAAIALSRLRPAAKVLPILLRDLAEGTEKYTTQATAYSLLALAAHLEGSTAEGAPFRVTLDGHDMAMSKDLGFGSKEFQIPLAALRGKKSKLLLESGDDRVIGFIASARWSRPLAAHGNAVATHTPRGPEVFRVFTTPTGGAVDLAKVHAGDVLRVAILARLPVGEIDRDRLGYLALTDRLPAGFEPIQPDLATVASVPDLGDEHPFASVLRWGNNASHVELHDDRVELYFDRVEGDEVAATYLVRASTPGEFLLPPAAGELMYEGDSCGYSDAGKVTVQ
jgi:alpha-2-macroglobulin